MLTFTSYESHKLHTMHAFQFRVITTMIICNLYGVEYKSVYALVSRIIAWQEINVQDVFETHFIILLCFHTHYANGIYNFISMRELVV